jgi:hypothetical protein
LKCLNFAFLVMGKGYDPEIHRAYFENAYTKTLVVGVENIEAAQQTAKALAKTGIELIELCGAFGEDGARAVIDALDGAAPVGYVTHFDSQQPMLDALFGEK